MDKFRYYIDLGSGYVLIDVYDNQLRLIVDKSNSLVFETKKVTGSIAFVGDTAEDAFNNRTTLYYVPFKIEEWNGTTWNTVAECEADIRGQYKRLSRIMTINKFQPKGSITTVVLSMLNIPYKLLGLITNRAILQDITSTRLDVYSIPTNLSQTDYIAAYELEGNEISLDEDVRWTNFRYYSTTGTSPNLIHRYSIQSFDYMPGAFEGYNGYYKMIIDSLTYWVKNNTPSATYSEETFLSHLLRKPHRLDNVLQLMINGIDASLSFDNSDSGDFLDATLYYLGYTSEFNANEVKGIDFTLSELFKFLLEFYHLDWYIDNNKLKFRSLPYIYFNSTLDWSTETANWDNVFFAYNPMPDREKWEFLDKTLDRKLLSYFAKGVKTDDVLNNYQSPFGHDFWTMKKQTAPPGKHAWIMYNSTTQIVTTKNPDDLWNFEAGGASFAEYSAFDVRADPTVTWPIDDPDNWGTRPIYSIKYKKWINDYSAFDLFSKITIDGSNVGYLNNYVIDLKTGIATFDIWFKTLNI